MAVIRLDRGTDRPGVCGRASSAVRDTLEQKGFRQSHTIATSETVGFGYGQGPDTTEIAAMDGRYLTADTAAAFTGRVAGIYAAIGTVAFDWFAYEGEHR
ncbi:hypothetical protein ABZ412_35320 [Nocardia sp. NPDC005746]|uniref:hypothetical protein n=1 Tax=Nocardia sp. NPDC005746 TaxID=3157062 RepID=UPI0033DA2E86